MRILLHYEYDKDGKVIGEHVVHTERTDWNKTQHPTDPDQRIDTIDMLAIVSKDAVLRDKMGWGRISNHPDHEGKTFMEIVHAECVRLQDADACKTLGLVVPEVK